MVRAILTGVLAVTCVACASASTSLRSVTVAPECMEARQPLEAVQALREREVVYTDRPRLINKEEVSRAILREYPPRLKERGIGGVAVIHALISEEGCVAAELVRRSSSSAALDSAALRSIRVGRFVPAKDGDQAVALWIEWSISFAAEGRMRLSRPTSPQGPQPSPWPHATEDAPAGMIETAVAEPAEEDLIEVNRVMFTPGGLRHPFSRLACPRQRRLPTRVTASSTKRYSSRMGQRGSSGTLMSADVRA